MTATSTVTALESALAEAKTHQRAEQREQWKKQLRDLRSQLRTATNTYNALAQTVLDKRQLRSILQQRIDNVQGMIDQSWASRPPAEEHLGTSDVECASWRRKYEELLAKRSALLAERNAVQESDDLLQASRMQHQIAHMQFQEQNLLNLLNDSIGRKDTGSIAPLQ